LQHSVGKHRYARIDEIVQSDACFFSKHRLAEHEFRGYPEFATNFPRVYEFS